MQSTVMLIMDLTTRFDLYCSEPDPQFDSAIEDLVETDHEVFEDLYEALHKAQKVLCKASIQRLATDGRELFKQSLDGR